MQCKCCGDYYLDQDSLSSIFHFSECCPRCLKDYKPKMMVEVFPFQKGVVEYHYLYVDVRFTMMQERYLSKHLSKIYHIMLQRNDHYDIFIFFDDDLKHQMDEFSWFINGFNLVFLFSLVRKEIIYNDALMD